MDWDRIIYSLPGIIIGLTVHEFCHAWTAYKLGDPTAKNQGRTSLNPLVHIDLIGFIFIILAGFGWAKPVQFSPENLLHPRKDRALIALAGPLSNLVLGIIFTLILVPLFNMEPANNASIFLRIQQLVIYAAFINFGLFIFNLLPIPPLDGSHVFFSGLNLRPETEQTIQRIGTPILFLLLIISSITDIDLLPIGKLINAIMAAILNIF